MILQFLGILPMGFVVSTIVDEYPMQATSHVLKKSTSGVLHTVPDIEELDEADMRSSNVGLKKSYSNARDFGIHDIFKLSIHTTEKDSLSPMSYGEVHADILPIEARDEKTDHVVLSEQPRAESTLLPALEDCSPSIIVARGSHSQLGEQLPSVYVKKIDESKLKCMFRTNPTSVHASPEIEERAEAPMPHKHYRQRLVPCKSVDWSHLSVVLMDDWEDQSALTLPDFDYRDSILFGAFVEPVSFSTCWPMMSWFIWHRLVGRSKSFSQIEPEAADDPVTTRLKYTLAKYSRHVRDQLIPPTYSDLKKVYFSIILGWGSLVSVREEWVHGLLGDRLLHLASSVVHADALGSEILLTTLTVVSELVGKVSQGQSTDGDDLPPVVTARIRKFCNEKKSLILQSLVDHHVRVWPDRPILLSPHTSTRRVTVLEFTGLAYLNRVCPFLDNDQSEDFVLRSLILGERYQRFSWHEQLVDGAHPAYINLFAYVGDEKSTLAESLPHLRSLEAKGLRIPIRINYIRSSHAARKGATEHVMRNLWMARMAGAVLNRSAGFLEQQGNDVFRLQTKETHRTGADFFAIGRLFGLSILLQIPLGIGLSENLWNLYLNRPLSDDIEQENDPGMFLTHVFRPRDAELVGGSSLTLDELESEDYMEPSNPEQLCPTSSTNFVSCFLEGFADVLPRELLVHDAIVSSREINHLLIGERHISPLQLMLNIDFPTTTAHPAIVSWFQSIITEDMDQTQIRLLIAGITGDTSPVPAGGLSIRLFSVKVIIDTNHVGDDQTIILESNGRAICIPVFSTRDAMKRNIFDILMKVHLDANLSAPSVFSF